MELISTPDNSESVGMPVSLFIFSENKSQIDEGEAYSHAATSSDLEVPELSLTEEINKSFGIKALQLTRVKEPYKFGLEIGSRSLYKNVQFNERFINASRHGRIAAKAISEGCMIDLSEIFL
ncbi:MAG: hypothetical protein JW860_08445 [Sedimentisphaerales bacterium]|nr:hypothetical protein [Sedimentisphaerales bacterium]